MNTLLKLFAVVVFIQLYIEKIDGLKCYTCNDCEKGDVSKKDCGSLGDTCLKFDLGDTVMKSCIRKELCNLKGVENTLASWWASLTNKKLKKNEDAINCCQSDYCNSGSNLSWSLSILIFGGAVAVFYG